MGFIDAHVHPLAAGYKVEPRAFTPDGALTRLFLAMRKRARR